MTTIDNTGAPFDFKGHQYVAVAANVRRAGGEITWDNLTKRATITHGGRTIEVLMADETLTIDGQQVELRQPPLVMDGTLIAPIEMMDRLGIPV